MSIAQLKKKGSSLNKLQERVNKMKEKQSANKEDTYWKLTVDELGNGQCELRFLPAIDGEDYPFVTVKEYGFGIYNESLKKKVWYFNRSLETIGKKDPVKDEFWALYNLGTKEAKEEAKLIRDRENVIVWVYIVKDKMAPQNNGKVMKTKLSRSLWEMVEKQITPFGDDEYADDPVDVFDFWEGRNLLIVANNGDNNMRTYENSKWLPIGPLFKDDDKIEEVYSQVKGLADEIDPASPHYKKTYAELEQRLEVVLNRPLVKNRGATKSLDEELTEILPEEKQSHNIDIDEENHSLSDEEEAIRRMIAEDDD
jgi:hypothetical protein